MSWPALSDFQEAVQTPRLSFSDADLQQATPDLDSLGLPRAMSGNFAVVFPVRSNSRKWAVRCFSTFHDDQATRYSAISSHLLNHRPSCVVDFQFQPQGIRVRGRWYPILKMEWIEGEPLSCYVQRNLSKPHALFVLAQQFMSMVADLERHSIAHGDLQHGNLLVVEDSLYLVDYDGMYVPSLSSMGSHELGHINYQHPRRTFRDFGQSTDRFSAWIIYLSLLALSIRPDLWTLAGGGDDYLLFRKEDFWNPLSSKTLHTLQLSSESTLRGIAAFLAALVQKQLSDVPQLNPASMSLVTAPQPASAVRLPDWLEIESNQPESPNVAGVVENNPAVSLLPDWISDQLEPASSDSLEFSGTTERKVLRLWAGTAVVLTCLWMFGGIVPFFIGGLLAWIACNLVLMLVALAISYERSPVVCSKRVLTRLLEGFRNAQERLQQDIHDLQARRQEIEKKKQEALTQALSSHQRRFTLTRLASFDLGTMNLNGIGPELKARLLYHGYRTAADIDSLVTRVPGIGEVRASKLLAWQYQCRTSILPSVPSQLPASDLTALETSWNSQMRSVEREVSDKQSQLSMADSRVVTVQKGLAEYQRISFVDYLRHVLFEPS